MTYTIVFSAGLHVHVNSLPVDQVDTENDEQTPTYTRLHKAPSKISSQPAMHMFSSPCEAWLRVCMFHANIIIAWEAKEVSEKEHSIL